jgi:hypothetical protein
MKEIVHLRVKLIRNDAIRYREWTPISEEEERILQTSWRITF